MSPKTVTAAVLVSLMGLMWLRLLFQGGPKSAEAEPIAAAEVTASPAAAPFSVRAAPLTFQKGFHDQLHRDPFSAASARWFGAAPEAAAEVEAGLSEAERERQKHERNLKEIADYLTIEAIIHNADGSRQAFASGKVVMTGSKLKVARNGHIYELTAEEITDTEVIFTWQAFSITVTMSPSEWVEDGKDGVL